MATVANGTDQGFGSPNPRQSSNSLAAPNTPPPTAPSRNDGRAPSDFRSPTGRPPLSRPPMSSHAPGNGRVEGGTQCDMGTHFAMVRFGLDKLPLIACVWCPIVLLLNGVSFALTWRVAFATSRAKVDGKTPPYAYYVLQGWLLFAVMVTHVVSIPLLFSCSMMQDISIFRKKVRNRTFAAAIFHSVFVLIPIAICEGVLLFLENDYHFHLSSNRNVKAPWLAGLSFGLSTVTPIVLVWLVYLDWIVDRIVKRAQKVANAYVLSQYGDRLGRRAPVTRVPPIARASPEIIAAAEAEERAIEFRLSEATQSEVEPLRGVSALRSPTR
jgi:hypothetical protein